jgi:hypothetical protein
VLVKTLKAPIVCWPNITRRCAADKPTVLGPGEMVRIRDNEERRANGQMSVIARDRIMFCSCEQFWDAVT